MLAIFKKINPATLLRMDHGKKLGSKKGGLDTLWLLGKSCCWLGYPAWDLFRKSRQTGECLGRK